jgi:hypothetical protein
MTQEKPVDPELLADTEKEEEEEKGGCESCGNLANGPTECEPDLKTGYHLYDVNNPNRLCYDCWSIHQVEALAHRTCFFIVDPSHRQILVKRGDKMSKEYARREFCGAGVVSPGSLSCAEHRCAAKDCPLPKMGRHQPYCDAHRCTGCITARCYNAARMTKGGKVAFCDSCAYNFYN